MWPVSGRWDAAISRSHDLVYYAEIWRAGSFTGVTIDLEGEVTGDESSKERRYLRATSGRTDLAPSTASSFLSPVDTDVRVFSGIRYTEGDTEVVPVGVFRLDAPGRRSIRGGGLEITGGDFMSVLAMARFLTPWNTPAGRLVVDEIKDLVLSVLPYVDVIDLTGSLVQTRPASWDSDRVGAIEVLAASIGAEAAFDAGGRFVIRPVPTTSGPVAWDIATGEDTSVLIDASVGVNISNVYNAVRAFSSDGSVSPVTATVYQKTGPMAYRPGFQVTRRFASPVLTTTDQCAAAASAILSRSLAFSRRIAPTTLPNPALDIGDVVTLTLPGEAQVTRVISRFTLPVGPGPMQIETRESADPATALEGTYS